MKQYKPREKVYHVDVEVVYLPFPSEKARDEAYDTHIKLFLKAKEREFMEKLKDKRVNNYSQKVNILKIGQVKV